MPVSENIRQLILRRASGGEIRHEARAEGMRTLRDDGWRHVLQGRTTVEEVLRVTKDERASGALLSNGNGEVAGGEPASVATGGGD
jgi:hypothetical protein